MTGCDDLRILLGSYALGGLEPAETAMVRRHLAECAECRSVHESFGRLAPLLDLVEPVRSLEHQPPALLESAVLAGYRARPRPARRRRQWPRLRVAVPSALAGAALAAGLLTATGGPGGPGDRASRIVLASPTGAGQATARLADTATGTRVELDARLPPLRDDEIYELWFVRADGRVSAGTFVVDDEGRAELALTTAARAGSYQRLGITREPDALDPARNGPSVATGRL